MFGLAVPMHVSLVSRDTGFMLLLQIYVMCTYDGLMNKYREV